MNSYDKRYAPNWLSEIVPKAHRSTRGICCYCHARPSQEIHHAVYRDFKGAIAGREESGIHIFPLCENCHKTHAHGKENWVRSRTNPELENRNTDEFLNRLIVSFEILKYSR